MTASAANGFGQVKFLPNPSKKCVNLPYDFHPMYSSTSTHRDPCPGVRPTYNVAIDTEIGHFDYCSTNPKPFGSCTGEEDTFTTGHHPADVDDDFCFPARMSTRVKVNGCLDSNTGFDGTSYLPDWPNGNTTWRPGPVMLTAPTTGSAYDVQYPQVAFNVDLPRIEDDPHYGGSCNRDTGAGCTRIPLTDDGAARGLLPVLHERQGPGRLRLDDGPERPRLHDTGLRQERRVRQHPPAVVHRRPPRRSRQAVQRLPAGPAEQPVPKTVMP